MFKRLTNHRYSLSKADNSDLQYPLDDHLSKELRGQAHSAHSKEALYTQSTPFDRNLEHNYIT